MKSTDTIAAIATSPGRGGVGIVRVSGSRAQNIGQAILLREQALPVRHVLFGHFHAADGGDIDEGLVLFFQGPHSFTGEDVLELQGHGGPVVMDMLLQRVLALDPVSFPSAHSSTTNWIWPKPKPLQILLMQALPRQRALPCVRWPVCFRKKFMR